MICLGACLAIWITFRELDRLGLDHGLYLRICLIAFVSGIVGARVMNCIVFYDLYRRAVWWKWVAIWEGGLAMYGGVLLAMVTSYAYTRYKRQSFWQVADTLSPPWMVLLILGRLGCFLNGCCYGKPTMVPWGFLSRNQQGMAGYAPSHPTQIYSAAAALIIFMVMWRARLRPHFQGRIVLIFLLLYPVSRFIIEYFRADPRGMWRFFDTIILSESQILSIPLFLFALGAWAVLSRREQVSSRHEGS